MEVSVIYTMLALCLLCVQLVFASSDVSAYYPNRKSRLRYESRARLRSLYPDRNAYYSSGRGPYDDDSWDSDWSGSGSGDDYPSYHNPRYETELGVGTGTGKKQDDDIDDIYIEQPIVADNKPGTAPLGRAALATPSCLATALATAAALALATRHRLSTGLGTIGVLATLWVNG